MARKTKRRSLKVLGIILWWIIRVDVKVHVALGFRWFQRADSGHNVE